MNDKLLWLAGAALGAYLFRDKLFPKTYGGTTTGVLLPTAARQYEQAKGNIFGKAGNIFERIAKGQYNVNGSTEFELVDARYDFKTGTIYAIMKNGRGQTKEVKQPSPPSPQIQALLADHLVQEAEDYLKSIPKEQAHKLKCQGAEALNNAVLGATGTSPQISCEDSMEVAVNKAAAIAGAAGGVAICSATGVGASVAPLCGMAGSFVGVYLGDKLGGVLDKAWNKTKGAAKKVWKSTIGKIF